jgi:HAE1 family hydrophobic/amphiphilic exporter-1
VIAWALHHRVWMAVIAGVSFVVAIVLHATLGGSSFLPAADNGMLIVNVRTFEFESGIFQTESRKSAELARTIKETKATNSTVNLSGGRVYVDIGKSTERERSAAEIAVELRKLVGNIIGAEYVVQDDLNNGGGKPVQIQFSGRMHVSCCRLQMNSWISSEKSMAQSMSAYLNKIRKMNCR